MAEYVVRPLRHQSQLLTLPWQYRDVQFFFNIGGYSSAKSFGIVLLMNKIASYYYGHNISFGVGSTTQTLFAKTIQNDLEKLLIGAGIKYKPDGKENSILIGTVKFYIIAQEQPKLIYAYNFCGMLSDEGDELEQSKCIELFGAISERCRVPLPAVEPEELKYKAMYEARMNEIPREQWDNDKLILEWRQKAHRRPFAVFSTTAQGLRGMYQITENLKEKGIPYILVRGLTKDNIYNAPDYYQKLYDIYTPNEREAFLEGKFVSLTAGKVYPSYDEVRDTVDDFPIDDDAEIWIGQDLNIASSCATAMIKRDRILYIVKEWQFKDFGQAATIMRRDFPTQKLTLYPDASGKMIISGYLAEFTQNNIEIRMANSNPPVIERIFLCNKMLLTERMKRFKSCKNLNMAWKTRIYTEHGDPEKSKVHPAPDDQNDSHEYCLWRLLSEDADFYDLYSLTRSFAKSK